MRLIFSIIVSLLLASSLLHGGFSAAQIAQAKAMVTKNPSLLNTPKAKNMMKQYKQQKAAENSTHTTTTTEPVKNDITEAKKTDKQQQDKKDDSIIKERAYTAGSLRLSPQKYRDNDEELYRLRTGVDRRVHKRLERFSQEFFRNKNKVSQKNINAPSNYVINRGDTITFWVYGASNKQHSLKVNNQGNINIPEIGPVRVAGEKYGEVKELLTNYLSSSYKNSEVVVDLNSFSTAQVTLTGFVKAPGIFNTTSVSSVKDILIEAHGVSDVGSVRNIQVKRDGNTISTLDYYHLLTLGLEHGDVVLQPGDTIYVPRAYGLVRLEGAVNKEAIYEIERGESLRHILSIAGGVESKADGMKIHIKRYTNNRSIKYLEISLRRAGSFTLRDGDEIYVGEMDSTNEHYVEILGNVVNPGKKEINRNSIKLSSLLRKEMKNRKLNSLFLPNTKLDYAVVKRVSEDTSMKMYNVNLKAILDGQSDFTLHNRDILYVYNQLDTGVNQFVTIKQAFTQKELYEDNRTQTLLLQDGQFQFTEGMTIKDLINAAGVKGAFDTKRVKIIGYDANQKKADVKLVDYETSPDYALKPFDTVYLFDFFETTPTDTANVSGEVIKPGRYEVSAAMTLKQFLQTAGGLTERAYPLECEIIRYHIDHGERKKKIFNIDMDKINSFLVQAHDEINIRRIPNWNERKTVVIEGEVKFPGTYVINNGERLSSVIERAGGYTKNAFLYGAVFTREEVSILQQKSLRMELSKLKEQVILASLRASGSKLMNSINIKESIQAVESLVQEAENLTPIGRVSINLGYNENDSCDGYGMVGSEYVNGNVAGTTSDLVLKDKDKLFIPSFNDTVLLSGEVMNPMASIYLGDNVKDYVSRSGGLTEIADMDHIYVLHANGEAERATMGTYLFSSNKVTVKKGDVIIVPKKLMFQRGIDIVSEVADIFYKLTLTVAAMHTVGAL